MQGMTSGDIRLPATFDTYLNTNIDFLDVHIYYANTNGNTVLNSFADDLTYMNFWTDEVQELLKKKPLFMGEFGPNARIFPTPEKAREVWVETVRLATESGFKGFAVWTLESHNQTECWNILADDGKFDLFLELVSIHTGLEIPENGGTDKPDQPETSEPNQESAPNSEQTPESSVTAPSGKGGCGGSIAGVGLFLLILPAAVLLKRKNR